MPSSVFGFLTFYFYVDDEGFLRLVMYVSLGMNRLWIPTVQLTGYPVMYDTHPAGYSWTFSSFKVIYTSYLLNLSP